MYNTIKPVGSDADLPSETLETEDFNIPAANAIVSLTKQQLFKAISTDQPHNELLNIENLLQPASPPSQSTSITVEATRKVTISKDTADLATEFSKNSQQARTPAEELVELEKHDAAPMDLDAPPTTPPPAEPSLIPQQNLDLYITQSNQSIHFDIFYSANNEVSYILLCY